MFDPFKDFESSGYLRNSLGAKDAFVVKRLEHELFMRKIADAIKYLSSQNTINYKDFLQVHNILFSEFYPWAGQDRSVTAPTISISKADVIFSHPQDISLAINEGLRLGQLEDVMAQKPGEVMGLFAYGHPFLDGNGRTILLVHLELTYRAGFSISWADTNKTNYLNALGDEIKKPGGGILDAYLQKFKGVRLERHEWSESILSIKGLDGFDDDNQVDGDLSDADVADRYRQFEQQRGYTYKAHDRQVFEVRSLSFEELSFEEASKMASEKASVVFADTSIKKPYGGRILGITDFHVVQNQGKTAVIHRKVDLDRIPDQDELVNIKYKNGLGVVEPRGNALKPLAR